MRCIGIGSLGGFVAAAGVAFFLACSGQDPEADDEPAPTSLVSLSLVQASIANGADDFSPSPLPFTPEVFHPDSLAYTAKALEGEIAVFLEAPPRHGLSVSFNRTAVAESKWRDDRPCYLIETTDDGELEILLKDSVEGDEITYVVSVDVKTSTDTESPSLEAMTLSQVYYNRSVTFLAKPLTPNFHPDSLEYSAWADSGSYLRFTAVPSDTGPEIIFEFNDSIVSPIRGSGGPAFIIDRLAVPGRFTAKLRDFRSEKSRTYVLTIGTWSPMNSGEWLELPKLAHAPAFVDFLDGNTGFILLDQGSLLKTTDGAKTWSEQAVIITDGFDRVNSLDFVDTETGFLIDSRGNLKGTRDGGKSWTLLPASRFSGNVEARFLTARSGFVRNKDTLSRTLDGGATWSKVELGTTVGQMEFLDSSEGFVYDAGGKILKTSDGGDSWEDVSGAMERKILSGMLSVVDSGNLFLAARDTLLKTQDGGRTWSIRELPRHYTVTHFVFTDPMTGYLAATEPGGSSILKTVDGGNTWKIQYRGRARFRALKFPGTGTGFAFDSDGMVLMLSQ